MISIALFMGFLVLCAVQHWDIVGAGVSAFAALNGFGAAWMASRNPSWYIHQRAAAGEAQYALELTLNRDLLHREIHNLMLVKIVTSALLTLAFGFFVMRILGWA